VALGRASYAEADQLYQQALAIYRQIGNRLGEANCLKSLGEVARMQARYAEAAGLYHQALPIYRQIADRFGEAGCLRSVGRLAALQHNPHLAREASELAAAIYSTIGLTAQAQQVRDEFTQSQS
jgi:tetratricopeptide (TPR) repeat protein